MIFYLAMLFYCLIVFCVVIGCGDVYCKFAKATNVTVFCNCLYLAFIRMQIKKKIIIINN